MLVMLKYILWILTVSVPFANKWFFKFTEDDPSRPHRLKITKPGRVAFAFAILAFALAFGLTVHGDQAAKAAAEEAERQRQAQSDQIEELEATIAKALDTILAAVSDDDASGEQTRRALAELDDDKGLQALSAARPAVRNAKSEIMSRVGGRRATLGRLGEIHPGETFRPESIATLATFSLRGFSARQPEEVLSSVLRVIRGLEADVVALQEVNDQATMDALRARLREFVLVAGAETAGVHGFPALLIRRDRVERRGQPFDVPGRFVRSPLGQSVTCGGVEIDIVNVQFSSRPRGTRSNERIADEVKALRDWIAARSSDRPLVVTGILGSHLDDPLLDPLTELGGFFATRDLPAQATTSISERPEAGVISHFYLRGFPAGAYIAKSVHIYDLPTLLPELSKEQIRRTISDHNPVAMSIRAR